MKKTKKKLKGMTLLEIIISVAVLGILSLVLLTIGISISNTTMATNKLKNKIVQQSPYAANRITTYYGEDEDGNPADLDIEKTDMQIQITITGVSGEYTTEDENGNEITIKYGKDDSGNLIPIGPTLDVEGYNTKDVVEGGPSLSKTAENLNLKFINFPDPEESEET